MSGPKVVRVVTREELLARALDQIAALEISLERYDKFARSHDVDIEKNISSYRRSISELKGLINKNSWDEISARCAEIGHRIDHDRHSLEVDLTEAAAKDRRVRRRLKDAARTIQREISAQNNSLYKDLEDVVTNVDGATIDEIKHMEATVAAAARAIIKNLVTAKSGDDALAKRLSLGLNHEKYGEWLANNAIRNEGRNIGRLDKVLAELRIREIVPAESVVEAISRIQAADANEQDPLIDSLIIDLSDVLKLHRQLSGISARIEERISRLKRDGSRDAQDLIIALREGLSSPALNSLLALETRADEFLAISGAREKSVLQRNALLSGLTALGYEVREGMATALVENGRLVVKKPAEINYGVEIVSGGTDGRLQVRMVTFQGDSNPVRDKDAEVIWCGEFSALQAILRSAGHTLNIEKALAPGAVQMKRDMLPQSTDTHLDETVSRNRERSI